MHTLVDIQTYYPVIFGRKGGGSLSSLSQLQSVELISQTQKLLGVERELHEIKDELINVLHHLIQQDQGRNKRILNLKRDVFNLRNIKKYEDIEFESEYINILLRGFRNQQARLAKEEELYCWTFEIALEKAIRQLGGISDQSFFKNGLLFSSQILYRELQKGYFEKAMINKKSKRFYLSILKYLTRSLTKTTPFSSFNNIFYLEKEDNDHYTSEANDIRSYFSINNLVFYYIKEALLKQSSFKNTLAVLVNSTVWQDNTKNEIHFFINQKNNESLKKFQNSELLSFIKTTVEKGATYKELINILAKTLNEHEVKVSSFVDTIIHEGFLLLAFPTSFYNPNWLEILQENLEACDTDAALEVLIETLDQLNNSLHTLKLCSLKDRIQVLNHDYRKVASVLQELDPATEFAQKVSAQDLYYEDTLSQLDEEITVNNYENLINSLKEAHASFNALSYKKHLKSRFAAIVDTEFGGRIPLLAFYQQIYTNPAYRSLFQEAPMEEIAGVIQQLQHLKRAKSSLQSIDLKGILTTTSHVQVNGSFGVHLQAIEGDFSQIVLNEFSKGNGANASRFFNLCPDHIKEQARKTNNENQVIIADVKDASLHNTNNFPQLASHLISLANDTILASEYSILNVVDIFVVSDDQEGLSLVHKDGRKILPIQFSLEGSQGKSKMAQLLDLFDTNENFGHRYVLEGINALYTKDLNEGDVVRVPRLVFGAGITIQREKWLTRASELSFLLDSNVSLSQAYINLNKWRIKHGLPSKVFLKLKNHNQSRNDDHYKPQYVEFTSPIFVILLQNILSKANNILEFSEMLPHAEDVYKQGDCVKEYIVNVSV